MKRKWKIGAVALCVAVLLTVVYATAAGSENDPLITLSYLKNVFTGQVQSMVDSAVATGQAKNKADMDNAIRDWDAQVSHAVEEAAKGNHSETPASFASVAATGGQPITVQAGGEVIVRSGTPVCSGALIDQTDGSVLSAGKALVANHLYLATEQCTISVPSATVTGVVNAGPLNVRAGGGSSYDVLGMLQKDTVVTIVDDSISGWYMVTGGGLAGYVSSSYITLNPVTTSGPVSLLLRGNYSVG